ncbi:MAG: diguanylate cyclase [Acidobacteriota bacterium]
MKVLVADDDPVSRQLLEDALAASGDEVLSIDNGQRALDALQRPDGPNIAIVDWMMPGLDGIEFCRRVRADAREPYVYMILLTAEDEKRDLIEAFQAGVDDYLCKPFGQDEFNARVRAARRIVELHMRLVAARDELRVQAAHDRLTGLFNRGAILEMLDRELARSTRAKAPVTVVIIDMDHLKKVNDTHGRTAGDVVLREAAARMKSVLRSYDSLGRYGGEEFLGILPGCGTQSGMDCARRMCTRVGNAPIETGEARVTVTASLGVSVAEPWIKLTSDMLLSAADAAMHRAKHGGRNRVELAQTGDYA